MKMNEMKMKSKKGSYAMADKKAGMKGGSKRDMMMDKKKGVKSRGKGGY